MPGTQTWSAAESAGRTSETPLLELSAVTKRYGGVVALDESNFCCRRGVIHAVLGENGAGKSTLIKIIAGVVRPDSGRIFVDGRHVTFATPADAIRLGIAGIFQELSLVPDLSVAANLSLSAPPGYWGFINLFEQHRRARDVLRRIGCDDIHPMELVKTLPLPKRQLVEIAKAMVREPRLMILDEATSALGHTDVARIYEVIRRLRTDGLAILYISHRMQEIADLADVCSIFRNGRHITTFPKGALSDDEIVGQMIGRDYNHFFPEKPAGAVRSEKALELDGLSWGNKLKKVSLSVRRGEIVGLGGLEGQGQRDLLLALFGVLRGVTGGVRVGGRRVRIRSPRRAKSKAIGLALIPEDRKTDGLILPMAIGTNMSLAAIARFTRGIFLDKRMERRNIDALVRRLSIKLGRFDDPVNTLSGGNQQKVLIAKWLMTGVQVLLLSDPTRGIDVGTKQEIYQLLRRLADEGTSILLYSTDHDELVGCCDRVVVFYQGSIERELNGAAITQHNIVAASLALAGQAELRAELA